MSFKIATKDGSHSETMGPKKPIPLVVSHTIQIEAQTMARVRHDLTLSREVNGISPTVIVMRAPDTFTNLMLLVDQGPIDDGEIWTSVFNMSNARVRVQKGDVISLLLEI